MRLYEPFLSGPPHACFGAPEGHRAHRLKSVELAHENLPLTAILAFHAISNCQPVFIRMAILHEFMLHWSCGYTHTVNHK